MKRTTNRKPNSVKVLLFGTYCNPTILPYETKEYLFEKLGIPYFVYLCTPDEDGNGRIYKRVTGEEADNRYYGDEYVEIFDTFIDHGDEVEETDEYDPYFYGRGEARNVDYKIRFEISRIKLAEVVGDIPGYAWVEKLPKKRLNRFKIYIHYDYNGLESESIEESHKELSNGRLVDHGRKIY